jgi:DNA-binding NarL/FixJ family response regulator
MGKTSIILADDHQLFRNGLKMLLETFPEFEIAGEASNGLEFLEVLRNCTADIALVDINMPEMDGVEATKRGIKLCPSIAVIALSMNFFITLSRKSNIVRVKPNQLTCRKEKRKYCLKYARVFQTRK